MKKINIAIDGYSSCGKSTLAKGLAKELKYVYVDTGAMYRAVTLFMLRNGILVDGEFVKEDLVEALKDVNVSFNYNRTLGKSDTFMNGEYVEKEIRTMEVSSQVSRVSEVKEVREKLVHLQKEIGKGRGVVMDGRDIGTTVLPESELKIFMTATDSVRAYRRYKEMLGNEMKVTLDAVKENIKLRDHIDTTRKESPLRQAAEAIVIDNSTLTMEDQFALAMTLVKEVIEKHRKKEADFAIVVGGYNSSNTSHIVELCEQKFPTFFINSENEILEDGSINHFNVHSQSIETTNSVISSEKKYNIILTSGASCPDALVDKVLMRILSFFPNSYPVEEVLTDLN